MDEAVLKKVCKFLKKQTDNEAVFQVFWEGTKEFYPSDLSKTKVKAWLNEHPERFEIIKSETGNPFGKIKLKIEASNYVLPATTRAEDFNIAQKLIESIDNRAENGHLFAIICKNKAQIFPAQLRDKKHIRKWLEEHDKWFKEVKDVSGGLFSVEVLAKARHLKKHDRPLPPAQACEKKQSRGKTTPQNAKDETDSVDLLKMADNVTLRISEKLKNEGGTIPFESLLNAKDVINPLCQEEALISFLAAFPQKFEILDLERLGKWVHLKGTNNVGANDVTANDAVRKVTSFIFQNGGTVPFANLVKQADELIGKTPLLAWLRDRADIFEIVPRLDDPSKAGQVKVKPNFFPRFCQNYVTHGQCNNKKCQFLHICKAFICQCRHDDCKMSHEIRDAHNKAIVDKMGALSNERDDVVTKVLLKSYFPRVCSDYNNRGCPRSEKCHFLHVCGGYVVNECKNPTCPLSHDIVDNLHNFNVLTKYALRPSPKLSVACVKANIAYVQVIKSQPSPSVQMGMAKLLGFPAAAFGHTVKVQATNAKPYQDVQAGNEKKKRHRTRGRRNRRHKSGQASSSVDAASSDDSSGDEVDNASVDSSNHEARPVLSFENIQKGNLATSLGGYQKVENWMKSPTQQETGFENLDGQRKRSSSTSSSEISFVSNQSSVTSSHSSVWQDDLQKKVFVAILEKYNGSAPFNKISKDKELFGNVGDAVNWFESHSQNFILHRNGQGKIDSVNAFSRKARICLDYNGKHGCNKHNCGFLHICRNHIESHCSRACHLNHDVNSDIVTQAVKRMGLPDLTPEQLVTLIRVSVPTVCHFHNRGHCNRGEFCPNLHVCKGFAKGHRFCKVTACKHGHVEALKKGPATKILKMYRLFGKKPNYRYIQKMIFVLGNERRRSSGQKQTGSEPEEEQGGREVTDEPKGLMDIDLTQDIDNPAQTTEEVTPSLCAKILMRKCRRKKCSNVHFSLPYCWQLFSSSWRSFEVTDCENIEKYFCDVNCTAAELNISTSIPGDASSVRLDFQSMTGHPQSSSGEDFKIRRLECEQKTAEIESWCETPWVWYELESSKWIQCETNTAIVFEKLFLKGNFPVDWLSTHRRRPASFLTESEVQEKKRSKQEQETVEIVSTPSQPPSETALLQSSVNCHRTRVEQGSLEYKDIEKLLGSSTSQDALVINQMDKIVSDDLWEKYKRKKKSMTDELQIGEDLNDRRLFIPCLSDDIEKIMRGNIQDSSISRIFPKPFGPGYYLTSNVSLCIQWCREHLSNSSVSLIVCQVLLGMSTQGSRGLKEFPRRHDGKFYDSLVDNKEDPCVFVIENVDQCYPTFALDILYADTPVNETMLQDLQITDGNHGLTATTGQDYSQVPPPPSYVPSNNHPLSSSYVPQSHNVAPVVLPQQPLSTNSPSSPPDCVKAPPLYSERPPATQDPPPEYTPYPRPRPIAAPRSRPIAAPRGNLRSSTGDPKDKKADCSVM